MKFFVSLCTAVMLFLVACIMGVAPLATAQSLSASMEKLERNHNGKVAVFAINMKNGKEAAYRADERMAYCSTFKVLLAAEVMKGKSAGSGLVYAVRGDRCVAQSSAGTEHLI